MLQKLMTILFLSGEGISIERLAKLCGESIVDIESYFSQLKEYLNQGGLDLLINKGEVSIVTKTENADLVKTFWVEELSGELSPSALQVLTLVGYLGEVSLKDISFIRGVQSSHAVRSLSVRGLISKKLDKYSLSADALKYLGITRVEDLPEFENLNKELKEKLEEVYKED